MAGGVKPRRHRITLKNSTPAARSAEADRKIVRACGGKAATWRTDLRIYRSLDAPSLVSQ